MKIKFLKEVTINDQTIPAESILEFKDDLIAKSYVEKNEAIEFTDEVEKAEQKEIVEKELKEVEKKVNVVIKSDKEDKMDYVIGKGLQEIRRKAISGMSETANSGADGGALVTTMVAELMNTALEGSIIYPKCRKIKLPFGYNSCKVVVDNSDPVLRANAPVITSPGEGADKTPTKLGFDSYTATLVKQVLYIPITEELLEDVPSLDAYVRDYMRGKAAKDVDLQILNGTAASSGFIGVCTAGATNYTVETAWTTPTLTQVTNFMKGVHPMFADRAEWYMNPSQWASTVAAFVSIASNNGGMIVNPAAMTLMGKKVNVVSGLTSGVGVVYGDFSQYVVVEPQIQQGIKISDQIRFLQDEVIFRYVNRFAGGPVFKARTLLDGTEVAAWTTDDGLTS